MNLKMNLKRNQVLLIMVNVEVVALKTLRRRNQKEKQKLIRRKKKKKMMKKRKKKKMNKKIISNKRFIKIKIN